MGNTHQMPVPSILGKSTPLSTSVDTTLTPSTPSSSLPVKDPVVPVKQSSVPLDNNDPMTLKNPPAVSAKSLDKQMADKKTDDWLKTQGGEYSVAGKYRPDAASVQGAANRNKVCTEIIRAVQNKEYAEAIVRTHYRGQYVDTVVHHDFENSRLIKLLEIATKHPETVTGLTGEGIPIFKPDSTFVDSNGKVKSLMGTVMHTLLADIQFSIRDAVTKASSAGQAKILNQDWRDDVEVESEMQERKMVESLQDQ